MPEIFIPYKGFLPKELKKDNAEYVEAERRKHALTTLSMAIRSTEFTLSSKGEIGKVEPNASYMKEAKFYLEENNWDYKKSLDEYKGDLQIELEMYK
jgi:hypothetical protein